MTDETTDRDGAEEEKTASEEFLKREVPPATFLTIVGMYQGLAYQMLGVMSDPDSKTVIHPSHAKYYIDCLAILDEKTRGNLDEEERKVLDSALAELRLAFVRVSSGKGPEES
jgi:hypothetical protein